METNQESKKQDDRPFYKKKRFLIPAGIIAIGMIGAQLDNSKTGSSDPSTNSNTKTEQVDTLSLKTKLENNIKSLDGDQDLTKEIKSVDDVIITSAIFKAYAMTIKEGKESQKEEEVKLAKELEKKVSSLQIKNFPKLRLAYYKIMKDKLWENDIDVNISGSGNTILKLTAGYFAANKNIKDTQEALNEMLTSLRFKQTQYRWYKGADEFTYYTISSLKDAEIE